MMHQVVNAGEVENMAAIESPAASARVTIGWLYAWMLAEAATAVTLVIEGYALSSLPVGAAYSWKDDAPLPDWLANTNSLILGFYFIILIVTSFMVLRWIYRTNAIAQTFSDDMTISPGWNVGWFFVPIGNLWKPFRALREAWHASTYLTISETPDVPHIMRWWWALWLVYGILNNASVRLTFRISTVSDAILVGLIDIATTLVALPLGWCLIRVVRKFSTMQSVRLASHPFA